MIKKELLENIAPVDMPNTDLRLVAEICGIQTAIILLEHMPGMMINVPKNGFKRLLDKYILNNYDGSRDSQYKLALECGFTSHYVYLLIKRAKKDLCKSTENLN